MLALGNLIAPSSLRAVKLGVGRFDQLVHIRGAVPLFETDADRHAELSMQRAPVMRFHRAAQSFAEADCRIVCESRQDQSKFLTADTGDEIGFAAKAPEQ